MEYKNQLKNIIDGIRPQFAILGTYAFRGNGAPPIITNCFITVFEAYQEAKKLIIEDFGKAPVELEFSPTNCSPEGGIVNVDDNQMEAVYTIAKEQGFLPPPMLEMIKEFTLQLNHFFIAAQQRA